MVKDHFTRQLKRSLFIIAIFSFISPYAAFAAERYTVVGKIANIRTGPGTKYDIFCKAEKYYPLNVIKKSGNWYKVKDFEGDVGWIHKSLVKKMSSVITIKPKCNIRSEPGTKYQIVFKTNEGVPFKVIKKKGNWINVQHSEGRKGWIHESLVW